TSRNSSCESKMSFFFQAEDGIRDGHVTGVQTCALPIFVAGDVGTEPLPHITRDDYREPSFATFAYGFADTFAGDLYADLYEDGRSEERRVGKECRSGWNAVD